MVNDAPLGLNALAAIVHLGDNPTRSDERGEFRTRCLDLAIERGSSRRIAVERAQRLVIALEIPGPKSLNDLNEVNRIVDDLKQKFGVTIKLAITGSK